MTISRAKQLLATQAGFGGGYNRNGARLILAEIQKEYGQASVDDLIRDLELDRIFGFSVGSHFDFRVNAK
ncbi:MAG: hypothetical protein ACYDCF_04780 [Burkholderiales bacterium]|nr:hypothetical protein [Ferrovum sp.]